MQSVGAAVGGSVFHDPPNDFAGRLIAASGLQGFAIGGACLSSQNNNVLINSGQATAADLEVLIE